MNDLDNTKESLATDLYEIALLLEKYSLIKDCTGLYNASEKIRTSQNKNIWKYEFTNVKFETEGSISGTIPKNIESIEIAFSIKIEGFFCPNNQYSNPLNLLAFDVELYGFDSNFENFYAAWHLDKHIGQSGDNECNFHHPEYHFTFGGNKMEEKNDFFGSCLILPAPRFSYPPMDAILGIDFILQNYFPLKQRKKIMTDPTYIRLIAKSQERLWKPYYTSITSRWHPFPNISFDSDIHYSKMNPFITIEKNYK